MFELIVLIIRLYIKLLKLIFKLILFTGAYMILLGAFMGLLIYGFYDYYIHVSIVSIVVENRFLFGGAVVGGVFCLYVFVRNIARKATGNKKIGIVHYMLDQHRYKQAIKPPKASKTQSDIFN